MVTLVLAAAVTIWALDMLALWVFFDVAGK